MKLTSLLKGAFSASNIFGEKSCYFFCPRQNWYSSALSGYVTIKAVLRSVQNAMLKTPFHSEAEAGNAASVTTFSSYSHFQNATENTSHSSECITINLSEMEYIPSDNPQNIMSKESETIVQRVRDTSLVFLFLIGGPGNVINMAVFYKQGFKDRINLCLFALSLADELYLIMAMLHHAEQAYSQFTTKERYGYMITFLSVNRLTGLLGFLYVSIVLSAVIASERCYCVLRPLKYQSLMSNRTMVAIIIVVYLLVVGLCFIMTFRFEVGCIYNLQSGLREKALIIGDLYRQHKELVDYLGGLFYGTFLPGGAMIVIIASTAVTAIKLHQIVTWRAGTSSSLSAREVALTKMLIGTSILFIVCNFPFAAARTSWLVWPEMNAGRRKENFYLATMWIGDIFSYMNCSFNIFVYYIMGSRFRETVFELFTKKTK